MATNDSHGADSDETGDAIDTSERTPSGRAPSSGQTDATSASALDDDDEPDPALAPGRDHPADTMVNSTSGLQKIEEKPQPPDLRDEHELDEHHGLAHTTPVSLLVAVLTGLLLLTIVTVAVTKFDLGSQGNLMVAMVIATIKAALVVTYFMHLRWDRKVHLVLFLSSVLFVILFLSMALTDRSEYQKSIDQLEEVQANSK
jgi:cytochrome c oxidase subunit 4